LPRRPLPVYNGHMKAIVIAAIVALYVVPLAITMLKGKFWTGYISVFAGGPLVSIVGACRLAKPGSWWETRMYDAHQRARSHARFSATPQAGYAAPPRSEVLR
jgi:hypothetical protein